jgi:acyltransferase
LNMMNDKNNLTALPLENEKRRLDWVDTAKGMGIILVVMQHTALDYNRVGTFINSFHMPLFFFLSGFFFMPGKYSGFRSFASKKAGSLLLPYFIFAALSYGYFLLRYSFGSAGYYKDLNLYQELAGILYSAGTREWMDFNLPLWFLTCLFVTEIMFYGMKRLFQSKIRLAGALAVCSLIGYADGLWNPYKLPWGIDVAFTAAAFFGAGHLLRDAVAVLIAKPIWFRLLAAAVMLGVNIGCTLEPVNLNMKRHGLYYDFYLSAFAGVAACLLLASVIRWGPLTYLGRNALLIMACHSPMLNIASKAVNKTGLSGSVYMVESIRVAITILALIPVIMMINVLLRFVRGRSKRTEQSRMHMQRV